MQISAWKSTWISILKCITRLLTIVRAVAARARVHGPIWQMINPPVVKTDHNFNTLSLYELPVASTLRTLHFSHVVPHLFTNFPRTVVRSLNVSTQNVRFILTLQRKPRLARMDSWTSTSMKCTHAFLPGDLTSITSWFLVLVLLAGPVSTWYHG